MGLPLSWLDVIASKGLIAPTPPVRIEAPDLGCSEKEFQRAVVALAQGCGWLVHHHFDSRRSEPGWPDWAMVRGPVLLIAELKSMKGRVRPAQKVWLAALAGVPGVVVKLWRPADWNTIVETLTGGEHL